MTDTEVTPDTEAQIPAALRDWAASAGTPDEKLRALMPLYAAALGGAQRSILYCRQPELRRANTTHAWWSDADPEYAVTWPSWFTDEWVDEGPPNADDPLYLQALHDPTPVFIDDIEHDPTGLVNLAFEKPIFKHAALIHAPMYFDGKFYGILEPSWFGEPHHWTEQDQAITRWVQRVAAPIVAAYVAEFGPKA